MKPADVAIVGMACRFPKARDLAAYWRNILGARVCFSEIPRERWNHDLYYHPSARETDKTYARQVGLLDEVSEFAAAHYGLAPLRVKVMDPQHRLLLDAVRVALEDAGYGDRAMAPQTGVFIGASVSEHKDLITSRLRAQTLFDGAFGRVPRLSPEIAAATVEDVTPMRAFTISGNLLNMAAATVAQTFDLQGPAFTIDAACSSSLVAAYEAITYLRAGICDAAIAGGVYLNLTPDNLVGFSRIGAISKSDACRPFDARADGFVLGEGVGVVVMKRLADAVAAGDRIYAVVRGAGINNDGHGDGPMTPRQAGQVAVLARAYGECDFAPDTIGFIEAHGTATAVGDVVEVSALKQYFGHADCQLSSVKANIGHTMSAAGIAGLIKAAMVVSERTIPPQAAYDAALPGLELAESGFRIATEVTPWTAEPRRAGVSSFGFGGTNCHLVLEEYVTDRAAASEQPEPFVISAPNPQLLVAHLAAIRTALGDGAAARAPLHDLAFALATRHRERACVAFVARSRDELAHKLDDARGVVNGSPHAGIWYRAEPLPEDERRVAFVFPGQGAQAIGLCERLYARFASFRARLDGLAASLDHLLERPLLSYLYPSPPFDPAAALAALTATEICQPAMAALGLALAEFATSLGLAPTIMIGHSLGEFAAAGAAGLVAPQAALRFVAERGRLMRDLAPADRGAMAAVAAEPAIVRGHIDGIASVVVANVNHPEQVVISGTTDGVIAAVARLSAAGLTTKRLPVSHGFHSPVMAATEPAISALIERLDLGVQRVPVVSCIDPGIYSDDVRAVRGTMQRHVVAPVNFVDGILACTAHGARVFVQVGGGTALLSMIRATLARAGIRPAAAVSLALAEADDTTALCEAVAELATLGVPVDVWRLYDAARVVSLPATPLETERYWCVNRDDQARPGLPALGGAANDGLVALFREQLAVIQRQNELLQRAGATPQLLDTPRVAPAVVDAPLVAALAIAAPVVEPAPLTPGGAIEEALLDLVAKVSAFPRSGVRLDQRLGADLGFDSLMIVELASQASDQFPTLGGLPKTLFVNDATVGDLVRHVRDAVGTPPTPSSTARAAAATPVAPREPVALARYAPVSVRRPLGRLPVGAQPPFEGPVAIIADQLGVAPLLARLLDDVGLRVVAADDRAARAIVDLRSLGATATLDPACWRAPVDAARRLAAVPVSCFAVAYTGGVPSGLAGFAKALAREWPDARVKAIELAVDEAPAAMAAQLFAELVGTDPTVEVHYDRGGERNVVELAPARPITGDWLHEGVVVAISGGVRGLGGKLALELALRYRARLVLLGRADHGDLAAIEAAGGRATYHACDVRDAGAVARALDAGRRELGPIEAVVHTAGLIADAAVAKKDPDRFAAVIDTKLAGALALWHATLADPLRAFVIYASWSGRFGNASQTDYSAASHACGVLAGVLAASRPAVRVVALDLPPWSGSTMATSIPEPVQKLMRGRGVPFLDDRGGLDAVIQELGGDGQSGEILLGAGPPVFEHEAVLQLRLGLDSHPYLGDHRLDGTPVLPLAAAMDHAADVAMRVAGVPVALRDFELLDGVRLTGESVFLHARARRSPTAIDVELAWSATASGKRTLAYRGRAVRADAQRLPELAPGRGETPALSIADFYARHTFHGPRLRGVISVDEVGERHVRGMVATASPAALVTGCDGFVIDPLLVDSSFQLAAYFAFVRYGRAGLPLGFADYVPIAEIAPGTIVHCTVELDHSDGDLFTGHVDYRDANGRLVAQLRGVRGAFQRLASAPRLVEPAAIEINPAAYTIEQFPEYLELRERIDLLGVLKIANPYFHAHERITSDTTIVDGRELVSFSAYNYLGLCGDEAVSRAAAAAVARYGTSVSASRVASGEKPLHRELEAEIARFLGCEDAIVFVGGHATNVSVIGHVVGPGDLILHDSLAHDSILGGARLSGARRRPFPHNDWAALDRTLREVRGQFRRVLIAIEGVYSMDGDIAPLDRFVEIKRKHKALMIVDEAHSLGVLGATGRGLGEQFGVTRSDVELWMGTLSKTLASCGGYIAGSRALVEYLKYTNPGFVYSVGISPANAAAALEALRQLDARPELVAELQTRSRQFLELCRARDIDTGNSHGSAVIPCIVKNSWQCMQLAERLARRGINVQPIIYPAVEEELARLRFFITARHTEQQLRSTVDALAEELARLPTDRPRPMPRSPRPNDRGASHVRES